MKKKQLNKKDHIDTYKLLFQIRIALNRHQTKDYKHSHVLVKSLWNETEKLKERNNNSV